MIAQPQSALRVPPAVSDFSLAEKTSRQSSPRAGITAVAQRRAHPRSALSGLLQVFTCAHRNYFTRVMAQSLRNAGQGSPTLIVQFLKGGCNQGPNRPMQFGQALDWVRCRLDHCINAAPQNEEDVAAVQELWRFTRTAIASGKYDAVVLDELSLAIAYGIVPESEVTDCLISRPSHIEVTLTGQQMPQSLLRMADQVTELRNIFSTVLPETTAASASLPLESRPPERPSPLTVPTPVTVSDSTTLSTNPPAERQNAPQQSLEATQTPLMQLGLSIDGMETTTPHDLNQELPPVDELLVKQAAAQGLWDSSEAGIDCKSTGRKSDGLESQRWDGEGSEILGSQYLNSKPSSRKHSSNKSSGKKTKRSQQQQISLPGFD